MPAEACGYLASRDGVITSVHGLTNIDHSGERFSFDPKEQFTAVRDIRAKGLKIVAVYHSHPAGPARPSEEDIRLAYDPDMIHVIVSLFGGKEEVGMFRIKDQKAHHVNIEVIDR